MNKSLYGGYPGGRQIGSQELSAVSDVVRRRSPYRFYGLDLGRKAEGLEAECCGVFRRGHSLAVSSGTAALHTALYAAGVRGGDEVIIPGYAWSADLMVVLVLGAVPVIAPVDEGLGLDAGKLESCITEKTRAVIAVHMRGQPCDIDGIMRVVKGRGIAVIEDGAQCIGGGCSGVPVGGCGDISILSFQFNKLLTSGEGGMVLTDNPVIYEHARRFHDLGMLREPGRSDPTGDEAVGGLGLNYRMSELTAAFMSAQIGKMDKVLTGLKDSYIRAMEELRPVMERYGLLERPLVLDTERNHAFLCLSAQDAASAKDAIREFNDKGIPFQTTGRLDGHHFKAWTAFMERNGIPYRAEDMDGSVETLERGMFVEICSEPISNA